MASHQLSQLLDMLEFFLNFEVDDHTGKPLTNEERIALHNNRLLSLQVIHCDKDAFR
jgi:hypothetical protein